MSGNATRNLAAATGIAVASNRTGSYVINWFLNRMHYVAGTYMTHTFHVTIRLNVNIVSLAPKKKHKANIWYSCA